MRLLILAGSIGAFTTLAIAFGAADHAVAGGKPTTQACLGDVQTFLACPPGARVSGSECRAAEAHRGQGGGEHWSGSRRQGPALFLRDARETDPAKIRVAFATRYKDHRKQGRTFNFDKNGVLESWADMADDDFHGLAVECLPDGRVSHLAYFDHGKVVGVSRNWKASDGSFSFAFDQQKRASVSVSDAMKVRPDHLCQPVRCDVSAKPDTSGFPTK